MTNVVVCIWNDPPQAQAFQHFVLKLLVPFFCGGFFVCFGVCFVLFCKAVGSFVHGA